MEEQVAVFVETGKCHIVVRLWCNEYVAVRVYQEVLGTKREERKTKAVQPAVRPLGQPLSTTTA